MDLIQSNISSTSKFPSYIGTSILALPPNMETSLSKRLSTTSSPASSPMTFSPTASSFSASLTSPASGAHLCTASIISNITRSSHISLSTYQLAKGGSTPLLSGIVLTVCHTHIVQLRVIFLLYLLHLLFARKTSTLIPLYANPLYFLRAATSKSRINQDTESD
jgi:hypothetical protein